MAAKNSGKTIFVKSPDESEDTLEGQNFFQNFSISHRFRDKYVLAFYTEIQDGGKKWWEKQFLEKVASSLSRYPGGGGGGSKILSKLFYIATSEILKIFHFHR